ncbi:type II toxin-antitoxin system VapC family toxin [Deinococcus sp.]|uniref:type II toxin-antitoxin system VapC family toxin n=1 Tax=Deinococcus sp. TaxID=47478 RepID=UPI003B5C6E9F
MRLLLDTHILVWLVTADARLPPALVPALAEHDLTISAASLWELAIKHHLGKLPSVGPLLADVAGVTESLGASILNITPGHALRAGALAWAHRDPFDRMLVAQALEEALPLVTLDERLMDWQETPVFAWR